MEIKKNKSTALAELAKDLKAISDWTNGGYGFTAISNASRIIEVLANVPWIDNPNTIVGAIPCNDYLRYTLIKCRAIAEGKEVV